MESGNRASSSQGPGGVLGSPAAGAGGAPGAPGVAPGTGAAGAGIALSAEAKAELDPEEQASVLDRYEM